MNKYKKILSLLLCLVMLVCAITMAATADETNQQATHSSNAILGEIKRGTNYEMVSPSKLTTVFGYYRDHTGEDEQTFMDTGEGAYLTDGWYGRPGNANCTKRNGLVAAIISVDETIRLSGIEIVANDRNGEGDGDLIAYDIQAWVNDNWVEVASEDDYLFDQSRTAMYTFDSVQTNKVRILIYAYWDREPRIKEITLFEEKTGNLVKTLNLNDKIGESDCDNDADANWLIDGNKASSLKFTDALIDVDTSGKGVVIDGFVLYPYRGDSMLPKEVTISVLTVDGIKFEQIGTYKTGWTKNGILEPMVVTFDQPYMVTAVVINIDAGAVNEFELFQFERQSSSAPNPKPTDAPSQPTEPSTAPTVPSETPTEPSETPTEPSEVPTDPSSVPTEPSEVPTEPTEPSEIPTEPNTPVDPDPTVYPTDAPIDTIGAISTIEKPASNIGLIIGVTATILVIVSVVFFVIKRKR